MLAVLLIIALLDMLYSRWEYTKRMRMSRREVKEEVKRREGDPHVRAKIKELQREAVKRAGSLRRVPDADVLITNPSHLSVALVYRRETMQAPQVIAKGAGDLALNMRKVARLHRVPLVEQRDLAQQLFRAVGIDEAIGEDLYPLVARILLRVWYQKRGQNNKAAET
jgi:flagellar biosynthesis protein FlhB